MQLKFFIFSLSLILSLPFSYYSIFSSATAAPLTFHEIDPENSSKSFQLYMQKALKVLAQHPTALGRFTYQSISEGQVQIDLFRDLTSEDFERVRKDLKGFGVTLLKKDFERLKDPASGIEAKISGSFAGYMWDRRIYIREGQSPLNLASTLVHEVNHVLNRSEDNYYEGEKDVLREEYRSFYVEGLFNGRNLEDPLEAKNLKEYVIKTYNLKTVTPQDISDIPPGFLLPTPKAWEERGMDED